MKIFVTGASGFIGTQLTELLSGGRYELLVLAHAQKDCEALSKYKAAITIGDLKDISGARRDIANFNPEVCVHLAWTAIPDYSFETCRLNLDNSISLVNLIINETACRKIIISGSCLEYGKSKGRCKESDLVNINSFFAWAKHSLYNYSRLMCEKSKRDLIWFRKFYVYGNNQRRDSLLPAIAHAFKSGRKPGLKNPHNANDFIHVKDVARAIKMAVDNSVNPGIYNLGSGKSTKVIDMCKIVEQLLYGRVDFYEEIAARPAFPEAVNFWADINRAKKHLGWQPDMPLRSGIEDYLKSEGML